MVVFAFGEKGGECHSGGEQSVFNNFIRQVEELHVKKKKKRKKTLKQEWQNVHNY